MDIKNSPSGNAILVKTFESGHLSPKPFRLFLQSIPNVNYNNLSRQLEHNFQYCIGIPVNNSSVASHLPPRNWIPPATLPTVLEMRSDTQQPMRAVRATRRRRPQPRPVTMVQILHSALGMPWKEA